MAILLQRLALAVAGFAIALVALASGPVAFVTDVHGDTKIAGAAKLTFLGELAPAARLILEKGGRVTLMYTATGTEFTLTGPGEYVIETAEVKTISGPAPARRNVSARPDPAVVARVSQTATASLRMRSISPPAPAKVKYGLQYPRDAKIATLQPVLRWGGDPAASEFTVVVTAADGKEVWRGSSKTNSTKVGTKLGAGSRFTWTVASGGSSLGEAQFETLPADALARAEKSRAASKSFPDRVLHAFVLQDIGAAQDAREAWAALARERPDLPELAVLAK